MSSVIKKEVADIEACHLVSDLAQAMSRAGFGARRLGEAVALLREMISGKKCYNFLGVAGALVPCGLRKMIGQMITDNYVDLLVSTGANITHDLAIAFGGKQYQLMDEKINDSQLMDSGYFRIHDICISADDFTRLEKRVGQILEKMPKGVYGSSDLLHEIGKRVEDKNSIVGRASRTRTPIIVPAFTDSILGLQMWSLSQSSNIRLDPFKDLDLIVNIQFDLRKERKRTGALFLGGGVPKNYIMQSALTADNPLDNVIQIVADRPELGGLSGATPEEAKSWKKVHKKAKICTVNCDVSIALPFILSALKAE